MQRIDVPYLVVGAGPVGLMAGILFGRQHRDVLVVERRSGPQPVPAAHVVNARSFETCRQAGVDMQEIARASKDPVDAGHAVFVTRLNGEEIGRLPFEQQGDDCLRHTPTPLRNLSQHRFEPILARSLAAHSTARLQYGWQWERFEQDDRGVTSILRELSSGEEIEVRSRAVVAADGAGSRIRKALDIEMDGPPRIRSFLMIHFEADLRRFVVDRPGVLHWILDPVADGTFVAHDIDREWVYMHGFDPDRESEADFDDARCREIVERAIGESAPIDLLHRSSWHMSAQVAQRMREGHVFLAGDAAHRFPPTGGLGLNSGIQDVHGLVWRLLAVEDGWAEANLLDDYDVERRAVARDNADQSLRNALKLLEITRALGTDAEPTTSRMAATLADPEGRNRVEAAIQAQAEHFDMLGLQLGFAYDSGTIVPDGSPQPLVANRVREYLASSRPGARLPHAWVDVASAIEVDGRVSTLDLVAYDGFTLISEGAHDIWASAIDSAAATPLVHIRSGVDFKDPTGHWAEVCGLASGGALLVRPDQHVAWRARELPADPHSALRDALEALRAAPNAQALEGSC